MMPTRRLLAAACLALTPLAAQAQDVAAIHRGVPAGTASPAPIRLSLADAIERGLANNLAVVLEQQRLTGTKSQRLEAMSALLPHVSASVRESEQVLSTAAFGFSLPDLPTVIGPFGLFDARLSLSTPLFDARALGGLRAGRAEERAGLADLATVRETVVLAIGTLYLQAEADDARADAARAQVETAEALVRLAEDQRTAGVVAGIDVLRQQVQLQSARARLIAAENASAGRKLTLARAIGLPAGQQFVLSDSAVFTPAPSMTPGQAVAEAHAHRPDVRAAQARVDAARSARRAEAAAALPSLHLDADIGALGNRASDVDRTYTVAASLHVPIFEGGRTRARVSRADAELRTREAELADLTGGLQYDVEHALLDIGAADAGVVVADRARTLSRQELEQAQDRFRAGVSSTLELVEAQEAVATANEQYIASVYAHAMAKASLARAIGQVEPRFLTMVGGQPQ